MSYTISSEVKENMGSDSKTQERNNYPYVSAGTFMTTLDHIGAIGGSPNTLDRNALPPSFSGSSKYDVLHAFKFFGLIDKDGRPDTTAVDRLVDSKTRKEALAELLNTHYASLIALPLSTAGPTDVNKWFSDNASPSTVQKAKAFFIALAKQVGLPMHALVAQSARASSGSIRRKRKKKGENSGNNGGADATAGAQQFNNPPPPPPPPDKILFHPAVDAFLREARKLTEGETWTPEARQNVIQGFTTQIDLFLPVKKTGTH